MADTALFSTAEARAFDKGQLASASDYPDDVITAKEQEIREWFTRVCGVDFVQASHTEYHDGDGSDWLVLRWPKVVSVTDVKVDGVSMAAEEIDAGDYGCGLAVDEDAGIVTRRSGTFAAGWRNVQVTYTAGYEYVPRLIKRAALMIAVSELPATNVSFSADDYDAGGMSVSFGRGDGFGGAWHRIPDVVKALRAYNYRSSGVA